MDSHGHGCHGPEFKELFPARQILIWHVEPNTTDKLQLVDAWLAKRSKAWPLQPVWRAWITARSGTTHARFRRLVE